MRPEWKGPKSEKQKKLESFVGAVSIVGGLAGAGTMIGLEASGVVHAKGSNDKRPIEQPTSKVNLPENHVSQRVKLPSRNETLERMAKLHNE